MTLLETLVDRCLKGRGACLRGCREHRGGGVGRWQDEGFLGAALAGDKDADALDHLGGGAGTLGQKDIGGAGTIEGVDGAGDDHGGQRGVKLLGAADEFVAVHAGHQKIAEKKIERAGGRLLNDIERLLRAGDGDDAVAAGFEQEGADREYLFVVVDTEDRLLGAHAVSHSAGGHG